MSGRNLHYIKMFQKLSITYHYFYANSLEQDIKFKPCTSRLVIFYKESESECLPCLYTIIGTLVYKEINIFIYTKI